MISYLQHKIHCNVRTVQVEQEQLHKKWNNSSIKIVSGKETSESQKMFSFGGQENQVAGIFHPFILNPFTPGDFAKKRVLKCVESFSGHCHAVKS